nr:MAG: major capsid protein [Microvirus sp.]
MANTLKIPANRKMSTTPISVPRTNRLFTARGITSLPAGKMVPIMACPLLREDGITSGRLRFNFEMMETAEVLMNAVNVRVMAYLVPTLAFDRFEGSMDQLNRSWEGQAFKGLPVVPYVETEVKGAHGSEAIYKYLGLHARPGQMVNTMYAEAYNQIWNFRAANRSKDITPRARLAKTLAPAFWQHERFKHIVPDFDQAVIDGQVALNVVNSKMPVKGLATGGVANVATTGLNMKRTDGVYELASATVGQRWLNPLYAKEGSYPATYPDVYAEMSANGITVSLSNIELARKTQAFAKLREQYHGHSDEWLINMLMDGLTIPELALSQPMLVGDKATVFGMAKRFATDSGNLTESVVNGATFVDLAIQLPRIACGGVLMVVAEITPDQIFERQKDPFFHAANADSFPHYLRDTLDPEKVEVVPNEFVDLDHSTPNATFGYAPLNYAWHMDCPHVGGKFYRPAVDAGFDEDRQRIWAVETANPKLSADFYLCTQMHTKPFVVTNADPFECVTQGDIVINGNTVFGGVLHEATNDYAKVMAEAPTQRVVKP